MDSAIAILIFVAGLGFIYVTTTRLGEVMMSPLTMEEEEEMRRRLLRRRIYCGEPTRN